MRLRLRYCLIFLSLPGIVAAHGLVTTQSMTVGDYRVEFEYNTLGKIFTGDYTIYDTYLLRASDGSPLDFSSAFIRIQKKNGPAVMAGSLAESTSTKGYASMSGMIHDPGTYTAEVDFFQDGKQIVTTQYDFDVAAALPPQIAGSKSNNLVWLLAALVVGLGLGAGLVLWQKSRKKI